MNKKYCEYCGQLLTENCGCAREIAEAHEQFLEDKAIDKRDWLNKVEQEGLTDNSAYRADRALLNVYEKDILKCEADLLEIRKEIKKYFAFLETL